jgi:hypothetical protein
VHIQDLKRGGERSRYFNNRKEKVDRLVASPPHTLTEERNLFQEKYVLAL